MKVYKSCEELIGRTPLLELCRIEEKLSLKAHIFAKLESFNPAGSAKDRAARMMIIDAEHDGRLRPGTAIIEPTSGNTGIGLASFAIPRGYRVIIVMPETMSEERRRMMKAYGTELVLTDGKKGMKGASEKAEVSSPHSLITHQTRKHITKQQDPKSMRTQMVLSIFLFQQSEQVERLQVLEDILRKEFQEYV